MGGDATFVVRNVTKRYGSRTILEDVSFEVRRGEILGLIGASGAGKTTLLHMLVGFVPSSSGQILLRVPSRSGTVEYNVLSSQLQVAKHYGFASQQLSFYERLTVLENLRYFGQMYGLARESIEQNAQQLLQFLHLKGSAHLLAAHLSGGMKRRLDIACALIHNPPVLILDEPTADLDPVLRSHIWDVVKQINAKGTTVLLSSHHLNDLDTLCSRIAIIKDGRVVDIDTPDKLKSRYGKTQDILVETYPGNYDSLLQKLKGLGAIAVQREGTYLLIRTEHATQLIGKLLPILSRSGESLLDLKLVKPNIDDVFVKIYRTPQERGPVRPPDLSELAP
jgi:ABC-2 type transport system ATP-binding protein